MTSATTRVRHDETGERRNGQTLGGHRCDRRAARLRREKRERRVRENETDDGTEQRNRILVRHVVAPNQPSETVRDSAAENRRQHPQQQDLLIFRVGRAPTERQPDADDRARRRERRRERVAGEDSDRDESGGDDERDDRRDRRERHAVDESGRNRFGDVLSLNHRPENPEQAGEERPPHDRRPASADARRVRCPPSADRPRHEETRYCTDSDDC